MERERERERERNRIIEFGKDWNFFSSLENEEENILQILEELATHSSGEQKKDIEQTITETYKLHEEYKSLPGDGTIIETEKHTELRTKFYKMLKDLAIKYPSINNQQFRKFLDDNFYHE